MRILLVEDEVKLATALKKGLQQESFAVDMVHNGDDGMNEALHEPYDIIILDWMIPGSVDGAGIVRALRDAQKSTPILFLTAKDAVADRVGGLNIGADDYLTKPFAFEELLARIHALLRRPSVAQPLCLQCGDLSLDPLARTVHRDGRVIKLSSKEFALLEYLLRHVDITVSKDTLMQHVWDFDADILPNTVEVYIRYLRTKIDDPFDMPLIHTVRGFGYKISEQP